MKLWLITSIRMGEARDLPAPALQNLRTAEALARAGHRVAVWIVETPVKAGETFEGSAADPAAHFEAAFGRFPPEGLLFLSYVPHGPRDDKKTPFARKWDRWRNPRRAGALLGGPPDAIVSRSPLALTQLRAMGAGSASWRQIKLVLEWQYPESMQLWRGWRKRNPDAPMSVCVERLRDWRRREIAGIASADGILYAARAHESLLTSAGFGGAREMIPSACEAHDPVGDAGQNSENSAEPDYEVGYVGALAPENGLETLISALGRIETGRLLLVGEGGSEYVAGLRRLTHKLGLDGRIDFAGPARACEVWGEMRRCGIGVAPIERRGGPEKRQFASPLKLIEWLGAGVPVIASDVPSVNARVQHGREAWLYPSGDVAALAAAIRALADDAALRARLVEAGLAHAAQHSFAWRARRIADFIEALP